MVIFPTLRSSYSFVCAMQQCLVLYQVVVVVVVVVVVFVVVVVVFPLVGYLEGLLWEVWQAHVF